MFIYEKNTHAEKGFYNVFYVDDINYPMHFHNTYEINYIADGSICISVDSKVYNLEKGDAIIIFPKQLHCYSSVGRSKICIASFSADMINEFAKSHDGLLPEDAVLYGWADMESRLMTKNYFMQKSILYEACAVLSESTVFKKGGYTKDLRLLHKILTYVDENYAQDCSLRTLCRELKYSYSYISKRFSQYMNMSYTEYLNRYRISRAVAMLSADGDLTVSRICTECGFDSQCSFNRNFKKYTGTTPVNVRLCAK